MDCIKWQYIFFYYYFLNKTQLIICVTIILPKNVAHNVLTFACTANGLATCTFIFFKHNTSRNNSQYRMDASFAYIVIQHKTLHIGACTISCYEAVISENCKNPQKHYK